MANSDAQRGETVEFHRSKKDHVVALVIMLLGIVFLALTLGTDPIITDNLFELGPVVIPNWLVRYP